MINTAIIALPHSEPVLGSNTPYLQIGFALPFLLFHAKFLTFADKTVDFLGSTIPVSTFYDSTPATLPGLPDKFEIGLWKMWKWII
jgi:hypothetical protein